MKLSKDYKALKARLGAQPKVPDADHVFESVGNFLIRGARTVLVTVPAAVFRITGRTLYRLLTDPRQVAKDAGYVWGHIKDGARHYWLGSKLLVEDVRTAGRLLLRVLRGHSLTRRERRQMLRTAADLLRVVPFAIFIIVPFMEVFLPLALRLFPNMLPSTFQDSLKREEQMKNQLRLRLEMASFLQDTVREMAVKMQSNAKEGETTASADELLSLVERVRAGQTLTNDEILSAARIFKDEVTLDTASRAQLVGMSKYMGLNSLGSDAFLRFQLRNKIRAIQLDDQQILWEGVEALSSEELRTACLERGMRATGISNKRMQSQLKQWLDLSVNKEVPTSLLILSRTFNITAAAASPGAADDHQERALLDSITSMEEEVVTEAVMHAAEPTGADTLKMREMKLESIKYQNELIEDEQAQREAAKKAKQAADEAAAATAAATSEAAGAVEAGAAAVSDAAKTMTPAAALEAAQAVAEAVEAAQAKADAAAREAEAEMAAAAAEAAADAAAAAAAGSEAAGVRSATAHDAKVSVAVDAAPMSLQEPAATDARARPSAVPLDEVLVDEEPALDVASTVMELTPEEVEALEVMTSDTALEKERRILKRVKAREDMLEVSAMLARGRIGKWDGEAAEKATATDRVRSRVDMMVAALEAELDKAEETIGTKLHHLDRDKDGVVTTSELKEAIKNVLGQHNSDIEASALADLLDADGDGTVTVEDIVELARAARAAKQEAEHGHVEDADEGDDDSGSKKK